MTIEIKVPTLGESVTEATVGQWFKKLGDQVTVDEPLVELETDKVTVEVPAPASGVLTDIMVEKGKTVAIGALLGALREGAGKAAAAAAKTVAAPAPSPAPAAKSPSEMPPAPAARKMMAESGISPEAVEGSGKRGQILKQDVVAKAREDVVAKARSQNDVAAAARPAPAPAPSQVLSTQSVTHVGAPMPVPSQALRVPSSPSDVDREQRLPMSRLRQTIARRLKDAQNSAAMLTTFNDVDMSAVMAMRNQYKDLFEKRHGVKLGFMGFFVKACLQALKEIPAVNAEIDGTDMIYKNYYHIGVAVGTEKGLVVPVVRDADHMTIAGIEGKIAEFGRKARDGKLGIEDMQGGTFTISNGGVYGSMLSTPILNAPQSGILGMHRIEQRPVVLKDGTIAARPMMYLALSYDHRIVDGKEAVTFLVRVKENLEDPQRFILEL